MANSKQAIKRARQNSDRYKLRHAQRSVVRTAVKTVRADVDSKNKAKVRPLLHKQVQYFIIQLYVIGASIFFH